MGDEQMRMILRGGTQNKVIRRKREIGCHDLLICIQEEKGEGRVHREEVAETVHWMESYFEEI